ncbi:MAG: hypothetical protein HC822_14415 [Oscillochloris sp.]|nr:hypothetical protein [Oscillochloris sp.]
MERTIPFSIFDLLRTDLGADVQVLRCTKATLVRISHAIEDAVLRNRVPALIFTGFQESSHWREETARYQALSEVAQQICIFAGSPLPPESDARQLHVTLSNTDPLRQEWFLIVLSTRFALVLCGQDLHMSAGDQATREFDTIWSFESDIVNRVLDRMETVVANYRPERLPVLRDARANIPLENLDPRLITQLINELVGYQEHLQRSLRATSRQLAHEIHLRADLVEALVHDMRTPIQSIMQTIEFVRETAELDMQMREEMLELSMQGAANLERLVQTILDTNQLESGNLKLDLSPIAPKRLVHEALGTMEPLLKLAGIQFDIAVANDLVLMVCDIQLISRVLQNLVGNSSRYTEHGGQVRIEIESGRNNTVILRVRDTGSGIPADSLPHIFKRYYQDSTSRRRSSGIGLYFCRLVVEAHGGSIRADSQLGIGTTITIALPILPPNRRDPA